MLNEIFITLASAINLSGTTDLGPYFYEESLQIPAGESVIETEFEWNAVSLFEKDGKTLPNVYYQNDSGEYQFWHEGEEGESTQPHLLEILYSGDVTTQLKIKSEDNINVIAHFYNTKIEGENLTAEFAPLDDDSGDNPFYGVPDYVAKPQYISRSEWGADESLRTWKPSSGYSSFFRGQLPETNQVDPKYRPKVVTYRGVGGNKLLWPIQENQVVKKFIVHHTGEYVDEKRNPKELMRAIYYYHTVTKGWGDIGYNFVIDKQGNIYEGRAGGITSVGTHTAYYNVGTVGISLMGNFQTETPTDKQIKILTLTLADLSSRFNVNPVGKSVWLDTLSDNITGHRVVARSGHGTACPGEHLIALFPEIRKEVNRLSKIIGKERKTTTRDFLQKSTAAQNIQGRARTKPVEAPIKLAKLIKKTYLKRGQQSSLEVELYNNSEEIWPMGEKLFVDNVPEGLKITSFRSTETIEPGQSGVFRAKVWVQTTPNGHYNLELVPLIFSLKELDIKVESFLFPIQISGSLDFATKKLGAVKTTKVNSQEYTPAKTTLRQDEVINDASTYGPIVKVKLSYFNEKFLRIHGSTNVAIWSDNKFITSVPALTEIKLQPTNQNRVFTVTYDEESLSLANPQFKTQDGTLTLLNYSRGLSSANLYNQFRNQINIHSNGGKDFYVVNELPLEKYLWGLAEEPSTEPEAKKHAIHVLARSYMYVYSGSKRKFKTLNYDLEDSPATSQFYLGYDWERYHADQKILIAQTKGEVITYNGEPAIGPYFTQSSGESSSAWVSQYPWTVGRKLPFDEGLEPKGHGVGLSGNTARELAKQGMNYKEILNYFYTGIETKDVY